MSTAPTSAKSRWDELLGFLGLGVAGLFMWAAWPVSLWLIAALLVYWAFSALAKNQERSVWTYGPGRGRVTLMLAGRGLSQAALWVGLGILLVAVIQIVLRIGGAWVDPPVVRTFENSLSLAYQTLLGLVSFQVLAVVLALLVLVTLVVPHWRVVTKFVALRSLMTRAAFFLLGATSFTFFSALDVHVYEPDWRTPLHYEAQRKLDQMAEHQRDITAAAWIEAEMKQLEPQQRDDLAAFFQRARTMPFASDIVRAAGRQLAGEAPQVEALAKRAATASSPVSDRLRLFVDGELLIHQQPTLVELRSEIGRLSAAELRLREARTAAIELVSEAVAEFLPKSDRALLKEFVAELAGNLSRGALKSVVPAGSTDLAAAKSWVAANVLAREPVEVAPLAKKWAFDLRAAERVPAGATSELAMAALVARLHQAHLMRWRQPMSLPPTFTPTSPTYRPRVTPRR